MRKRWGRGAEEQAPAAERGASSGACDCGTRLDELAAEVAEVRAQNLRVAELVDVVQELLIPMASRDQARIEEAIERFGRSI